MTLSLFDTLLLIVNVILFTFSACYYSYTLKIIKRLKSKQPRPVDQDLILDIVGDLQQRGFSLIRLDSNNLLYRSPRV